MNKEENVVFILQKAIRFYKIRVTKTTIKDFLLAHPYYPSLKSVCDALNKWEIENYALNLELDEIKVLEMPFIAHLKLGGGQLAFVEEIKNGVVSYFFSEEQHFKEEFTIFSEKLSGAVIAFETNEDSGEKGYKRKYQSEILNKSLFPLIVITLLACVTYSVVTNQANIIQPGYLSWGLLFTKTIGFTASVILVLHELKISTPLADKICGFSSKTDCDTVLSSDASRLFGWINWADVGLIYFTGTFLFLIGNQSISGLWLISVLTTLALPYPVFSIYYQAFKAKKWCPFCLLVQLVLIIEFVLLCPILLRLHFSVLNLFQLCLALLIPASLWLIYRDRRHRIQESDKNRYSYLGFKRSPQVFKFLLTGNGYEDIPLTQDSLVLGNPEAPVTLTAFLSLYCAPCANAFRQLKELVDTCYEVKINAIFSVYDDEESKKLINTLYFIYENKGQEQTINFLYKWYTMPGQTRKLLYEQQLPLGFDITKIVGQKNKTLFDKYMIPGTPTVFINGYKYPAQQYDYSDIEYYIDDIKQINMESKRQEACTQCN